MTLLITGGAGFIGSNFVLRHLAHSDEPIINLDRLTYAGNAENLTALAGDARHVLVRGDIADRALVARLLTLHQPRAVLHFAAESHVDRSIRGPDDFIQTNIVGTFHLLEAVRAWWATLPSPQRQDFRFVHVSTDEVYGALPSGAAPVAENHAYLPNSPYSASKAAGDHLVRAWFRTYGMPTLTTHCGNNYGPRQLPEKLIPLVIVNALAERPLPLYGDGLHVRDWLYVGDHCAALERVLAAGVPGETYNVGASCERTNLDIVRAVCALLDGLRPRPDGRSHADQIAFVADRPGHDRRYALDTGKIERELGWKPAEKLKTGLAKTVQWYVGHPEWIAHVQARTGLEAAIPPDGGRPE